MSVEGLIKVADRSFGSGERVETDGRRFVRCRFDGVTLDYAGGEHPAFEECAFGEAAWHFSGAALRTIQFLQVINGSDGGPAFIADLFKPGNFITE